MLSKRGVVIHPFELTETWLDRAEALSLNVLGLHPVGGPKAEDSLRAMLDDMPRLRPLMDKARSKGMAVEFELHALSYLLPRTLFGSHPDWFRMNEAGERTPEGNFCVTSEGAQAYLRDAAEQLARRLPSGDHLYYFWLDDVTGQACHCDRCRALTPSDQQQTAVNVMLQGVRRFDPAARLAYIAYLDALETPRTVRPEEGVFLEYAPIRRRLDRPLADPSCPENLAQFRPLPALLALYGTRDAKVLDYWTDNSLLSSWTYPPRPFRLKDEVMARDVDAYRALGFDSVTAFACYLGPDYEKLHGAPDLRRYGEILSRP
jgi:hypothetical protein